MLSNFTQWMVSNFDKLVLVEFILLGLTLLLLGAIFLKRIYSKVKNEDLLPESDKKRIAEELTEDIHRLIDLRNRIYPPMAQMQEAIGGTIELDPNLAATGGALSEEALKNIESKYIQQIEELKKSLEEAKKASAGAPASGVDSAELENLKDAYQKLVHEVSVLTADKTKLEEKISHLEAALAEYELFEEDLSDVKKFKQENERLKDELKQVRSSKPTASTESNVASLTGAAASGAALGAAAASESAAAPLDLSGSATSQSDVDALLASVESQAAQNSSASEGDQSIDALFASMNETPTSGEKTLEEELFDKKEKSATAQEKIEENAEALAEAGDDALVAEFEKLLSE